MASLIPGFEYDVFISYRQKDNKYDRWVTEFVDNLKKELEATFKEEISVYFDVNPHDGLLETYDVDASLKEKLRSLVFIPVISRTYCDPKSFAWANEFKPFVEQASCDAFGLKIILGNGNVASRVLPVRIHDLDAEDVKLCEDILSGVLRSVDFIYKSPGVNRPLRANEDHPQDNLIKIYYRDQINKVANAIHEIIGSLKSASQTPGQNWSFKEPAELRTAADLSFTRLKSLSNIPPQSGHGKEMVKKFTGRIYILPQAWHKHLRKYFLPILFVALIVAAVTWKGYLKFPHTGSSKREQAMSHVQKAVKYFNDRFYAPAKTELEQALAIDPGYSTAWSTLAAVNVKLGNLNDAIMQTIEAVKLDPKNDSAAYNLAFALDDKKDYHQAIIWYSKAIEIDSALVPAYSSLGNLYNRLGQSVDAILILSKAKDKFPHSEYLYLIYKNLGNAHLLMTQFDEAIKWLELSLQLKPEEAETNLYMAKALEGAGKITRSIDVWQKYTELETDSTKASEARKHLKEITIRHLEDIIK
jgi:tetratricopeptide (TPR) repeat protein